jgi:hypothetical protein
MVWELSLEFNELMVSAWANTSLPSNDDKKEASVWWGVKNSPSERERAQIGLKILDRVFIKPTKYHEVSFLAQINVSK